MFILRFINMALSNSIKSGCKSGKYIVIRYWHKGSSYPGSVEQSREERNRRRSQEDRRRKAPPQ